MRREPVFEGVLALLGAELVVAPPVLAVAVAVAAAMAVLAAALEEVLVLGVPPVPVVEEVHIFVAEGTALLLPTPPVLPLAPLLLEL